MLKELKVNEVTLNVGGNQPILDVSMSIPVAIAPNDMKKLKTLREGNSELGVVAFSEITAKKIVEAGEAMGKELMAKI